ncbi:hypothetical protein IV505_06195 [Pseudomonas fulva]|nr:hypothetical protein [Pseudomonas fulva]MBF8779325.1 hypothetical protein [Pseudomonas fulva]
MQTTDRMNASPTDAFEQNGQVFWRLASTLIDAVHEGQSRLPAQARDQVLALIVDLCSARPDSEQRLAHLFLELEEANVLTRHAAQRLGSVTGRLERLVRQCSRSCSHFYIRKAYYLGLPSDGYLCVACGQLRAQGQWPAFDRRSDPDQPLSKAGRS